MIPSINRVLSKNTFVLERGKIYVTAKLAAASMWTLVYARVRLGGV